MATERRPARPAATGLWTVIAGMALLLTGWGSIVRMRYPDGIWCPIIPNVAWNREEGDLIRIRQGRVSRLRQGETQWKKVGTLDRTEGGEWLLTTHPIQMGTGIHSTRPDVLVAVRLEEGFIIYAESNLTMDGPWRWSFWRSLFVW